MRFIAAPMATRLPGQVRLLALPSSVVVGVAPVYVDIVTGAPVHILPHSASRRLDVRVC
jgi:hypothetical protein